MTGGSAGAPAAPAAPAGAGAAEPWWSPDGVGNARALRVQYPAVVAALGEVDALGHRVLARIGAVPGRGFDALVGVTLLRRAVTLFVGFRHLVAASAVEPAKLQARALFEAYLAYRYLVHGAARRPGRDAPTAARARETRARYFYLAGERQAIYAQQAALDGRWGVDGAPRAARRATIARELAERVARLDAEFPAQQRRYGPLLCYPAAGKRPRYYDQREWYGFGFRGGKDVGLRVLAERLGQRWEYEVLYASLSGLVHPRGIAHDGELANGQLAVYSPYLPSAFGLLCRWATGWHLLVVGMAARAYCPPAQDDLDRTYRRLAPALDALPSDLPDGFLG